MNIKIPDKAKLILDKLTAAGYEAYVVGGCVRDSVLGRIPGDWDITTSARPEEVKALFDRTVDTGIEHGTVTVMLGKEGFEVTTYRLDGKYEDGRHPMEVTFTPSLEEDLKRRDFTINAMAYNPDAGLVDLFGGMQDIERGLIRCVGKATERFNEDALRIMRAVRFAAQLGYDIDPETAKAIEDLAENLKKISAERIRVELTKLIDSDHPEILKRAWELGITKVILPEFDRMMETEQNNPHHIYTVGEHSLIAMKNIKNDRYLRLTMLFHDIGKPLVKTTDENGVDHFHGHQEVGEDLAKKIMRRLKFDNDSIYYVSKLVRFHDYGNGVEPTMKIVRRAVNKIGPDVFPLLEKVRMADISAQSEYLREEKQENVKLFYEIYEEIVRLNQCVSLKTLALNGSDLIKLGFKPGKEIGDTLRKLLDEVLEEPELNTKENLTALVQRWENSSEN
ncbi:MAG: CCA tRNA nucleotidyltransferase [Lachnospiraceae bacterium]|nr:CCA tRNA nucleotidyltransferase [Lachnospiraceae bacterium]